MFLTIDQQSIYYQFLDQGHDQTIVLINSLGSSHIIWEDCLPHLTEQFNILTFDKRGHGFSSTGEGNLDIEDFASDVIALMDHCEIKKAHLIGLSIGGLINYSLLLNYPERFDKAVFSNTGANIGTVESWAVRIAEIEDKGLAYFAKATIDRWFPELFRRSHPEKALGYEVMVARTSDLGYIQACGAIGRSNYEERRLTINHPALFIGGSADVGTTEDFVRNNAKAMHAECVILEGVGHMTPAQVPDEMCEVVKKFFGVS